MDKKVYSFFQEGFGRSSIQLKKWMRWDDAEEKFRGCPQTVLVRNADLAAVRCTCSIATAPAKSPVKKGGESTFAAPVTNGSNA